MSDICTCADDRLEGCSLHDPSGYLNNACFHQTAPSSMIHSAIAKRLPQITYCDLGKLDGEPVLVMLPSACSRWVTAFSEPQARASGMRVIAMDRPGVSDVEAVQLEKRLDICTDMTFALLEHIKVQPRHILVASAGIYHFFEYLLRLPRSWPLPKVYMLGPWAPPLNGTEAYVQPLTWIPTILIENQHKLLSPIMPLISPVNNAVAISGLGWTSFRSALPFSSYKEDNARKKAERADERWEGVYWGKGAEKMLGDRIMGSNRGGFGQEHLLSLARAIATGPEWFETRLKSLSERITSRRSSSATPAELPETLSVEVWWGAQDGMVPKKGRDWLDRTLQSEPDTINTIVNVVPDGNHNDLAFRKAGMGEVILRITGKTI